MQHVIDSSSEVNNCCQPRGSRATRCAPWNTTLSPLAPACAFPNSGDGSVARYTWYIHFLWVYKYSLCYIMGPFLHAVTHVCRSQLKWWDDQKVIRCFDVRLGFLFLFFPQCYVQTEWARWRKPTMTLMLSHVCWKRWGILILPVLWG